jgi:hypothetical protein
LCDGRSNVHGCCKKHTGRCQRDRTAQLPARDDDRGPGQGHAEAHALPPLANPDDPKTPAKELFGRKVAPTAAQPHVVGFYASGCLAGAVAPPTNGEAWQVMRLSRDQAALGGACWSATCRSRAVVP